MAIRLKTALGTGLLAAAALALGCSERNTPLAGVLADATTSSAGQATSFSGRATVLQATLLGLPPVVLVDAGPLPPSGGAEEASLLNANVPDLLTAEVLHASTVGQGNASRSEASVAEVSLTVAGNTISAGLLQARAAAVCNNGAASTSGSSDIATLSVNGQTITISGAPNQTVQLPVGKVIINEQSTGPGAITVNALHVIVPNVDVEKDKKPPGTHFKGAPMPYFMRIVGGTGLHAGYLPGYPASHGCIRMPEFMAENFFRSVSVGTPVTVTQ